MKLVDSLDEQTLLEELLDETKPPVPEECRNLHWLLFTPFRYRARQASRFRRKGASAGVLYTAEKIETAAAEMAFYKLLFFVESPATRFPLTVQEMTAFSLDFETARGLDVGRPPHCDNLGLFDPVDYTLANQLAEYARAEVCEAIRYPSVRARDRGANVAVMTCGAIKSEMPASRETWRFRLAEHSVFAVGDERNVRLEFHYSDFSDDPRIADYLSR